MNRRISALFLLMMTWQSLATVGLAQTQILNPTAAPGAITFFANDPDSPSVPGSTPGTITWSTTGGFFPKFWIVSVRAAGGGNFGSCPSAVPVNNVLITCASATASPGSANCLPSVNLTTSFQNIAWGFEGGGTANYTVTAAFTFLDGWNFIAVPPGAPCTRALEYRIFAF